MTSSSLHRNTYVCTVSADSTLLNGGVVCASSFGEVKLGVDKLTGEFVVIKKQEFVSSGATRDLLAFRLLACYRHTDIIKMVDYWKSTDNEGKMWLTISMELGAADLYRHWKRPGIRSGQQAVGVTARMLRDVLRGVGCGDSAPGLIHEQRAHEEFW